MRNKRSSPEALAAEVKEEVILQLKLGGRSSVLVLALEITFLLLAWQGLTQIVRSVLFPSPAEVWSTFWRLTLQGDVQGYTLPQHTWTSLVRVMRGFFLAVVTGIPAGIVFGLWITIYQRVKIVLEPMRFIPPLAWVPIAIIFFSGENRYNFLIWLGAFFPVLMTTMAGVKGIDHNLWEVGKVLGANKLQIVTKIVLPAAAPHMAAGLRLGMGFGWACIVAAEMIGGESLGLGRMIVSYGELLQIDAIVVGMLIIGTLGYLLNEIFLRVEKRLFSWQKQTGI